MKCLSSVVNSTAASSQHHFYWRSLHTAVSKEHLTTRC